MKPLAFSVLRMLSDNEFHSGPDIARVLGISRASVSNALRDVDEAGLTLYKIPGRGYKLLDRVQWLERGTILKHLGPACLPFNVEVLDLVDSTNTLLLRRSASGMYSGNPGIPVIAAELQTSGRGRRGRQWHSGLGDSLVFSLLWRFQQGAGFLSGLSLAVGVAIVRALESCGVEGAVLKWPNDVIYNFCKLAGILIELQGEMLGPTVAVVGVGMNLRLSNKVRARIDQGVTDVFRISGEIPDRNRLLAALLINIGRTMQEFEHKGFIAFREEWTRRHVCQSKPVTLQLPDGSNESGTIQGVAADGALLLRTCSGIRSFSSGEISLGPGRHE